MKKVHEILDSKNNVVGYTVYGAFDSLIVYLNGNGYNDFMHGETRDFKFYCIQYGWDFKLRKLSTTKNLESKDLMDMSYAERVCSALFKCFYETDMHWKTLRKVPTCTDIQKIAYQSIQSHIISHTINSIVVTGYLNRFTDSTVLAAKFCLTFTQKLEQQDLSDLENVLNVSDFYYYPSTKMVEFYKTFTFKE